MKNIINFDKNHEESYPIAENFKKHPDLKPDAKLIGANGNIFNLLVICNKSLHNMPNAYNELWERVQNSGSYYNTLAIIQEYVNVI